MKKKIIITAVSALGVLFLLTFAAAWYMLDYALTPATDARDMAKRYSRMFSEYPYMRHWVDSMKSAGALRDTFVIMPDGERQHAVYARADSAVLSTAVLVHGYKDSHINMLPIAKVYADMGYNILLPTCMPTALAKAPPYRWDGRTGRTYCAGSALPTAFLQQLAAVRE